MERKVITIRRRTGNGLTICDYCGCLGWDCMTYDLNKGTNAENKIGSRTVCSECLDRVRAYWLRCGYIVKEPSING